MSGIREEIAELRVGAGKVQTQPGTPYVARKGSALKMRWAMLEEYSSQLEGALNHQSRNKLSNRMTVIELQPTEYPCVLTAWINK